MKHLKGYNKLNEAIFDTSSLEDILLDFTDEGCGWKITVDKNYKNESYLSLIISFNSTPNWDNIIPSVLRVDSYLDSEGYLPDDITTDIVDEMESNVFDADNWLDNNTSQGYRYPNKISNLELNYSKDI